MTMVTSRAEWDWIQAAACRNEGDPEIYHPVSDRDSMTPRALSFCGSCPVRVECLEAALTHGFSGIWGGLTESERDRLLRYRSEVGEVTVA